MKEEDVVKILRHYRHDCFNDIQVVMGYAQMGKLDKVQNKLTEIAERMAKEQKLQNIPLPETVVAILQSKFYYNQFQLQTSVIIQDNASIQQDDQKLAKQIEQIFTFFSEHAMNLVLYHGTIKIQQLNRQELKLTIDLSNGFDQPDELIEKLKQIDEKIEISNPDPEKFQVGWVAK